MDDWFFFCVCVCEDRQIQTFGNAQHTLETHGRSLTNKQHDCTGNPTLISSNFHFFLSWFILQMLKPPDTPCARYFFWFVVLSAKFLIAVSWQRRRSHGSFQGLPRWCRLLVICGSIQSTQILAVQCPCSKCVSLGKWPEFRLLIFFTKHQTFPWLKLIWSFLALRVEMAIYI